MRVPGGISGESVALISPGFRRDFGFVLECAKQCVELAIERVSGDWEPLSIVFRESSLSVDPSDRLQCGKSRMPCLLGVETAEMFPTIVEVTMGAPLDADRSSMVRLASTVAAAVARVIPIEFAVEIRVLSPSRSALGSVVLRDAIAGPVTCAVLNG